MKSWILLVIAVICFALAAVVWGVGIKPRGGSVWMCPTCGARWYRGGGGAYQPVRPQERRPGMMGPGAMGPAPFQVPAKTSYSSPGEGIYYTDIGPNGEHIAFRDGPPWLPMHGGSCVGCHGPDGRGGRPVSPTGVNAPDIRYEVLTGKEHPAEETGHAHEHRYTDATIARAITKGLDDDGKPLDPAMPRFDMSEREVKDLVGYLKQLDQGD